MYFLGCFIVLLLVFLVIYIKGSLTTKDLLISLIVVLFSWVSIILLFLTVYAILMVILCTFMQEYWENPLWKAKRKSKIAVWLDGLLN